MRTAGGKVGLDLLSPSLVILSTFTLILSTFTVILSEAKDPGISAQG